MSTTPRTDAECIQIYSEDITGCSDARDYVDASFARQLETKLVRLRAEVERLTKRIKDDNRSYGCELLDPNGTIWEQAAKDRARAEKAEAELAEWSRLKAWGGTPEIVHKFIKSQQNWIHYCQDLETELSAAKAECDLNRTRLASLFWSGALDNYTGGEIQKWAAEYTADLSAMQTRAEKAEAESLEQARLLGISGSREAALLSEIECLKKIVAESQQQINAGVNKQDL